MQYQVIIPPILLIPIFMTSFGNHTSNNQDGVIVTFSKHAEAETKSDPKHDHVQIIAPETPVKTEKEHPKNENDNGDSKPSNDNSKKRKDSKTVKDNSEVKKDHTETKKDKYETRNDNDEIRRDHYEIGHDNYENKRDNYKTQTELFKAKHGNYLFDDNGKRESDEVIFVPTAKNVERNDDFLYNDPASNIFGNRKSINDVMSNGPVRVETEKPTHDIFFISGRNDENENANEKKRMQDGTRRSGPEMAVVPKLNCTNLDCNNTVQSVCGGKIEHKQWRYRLFLNECFFRKVNCYFQHAENRYLQVPLDKCKNTGAHGIRPSPVIILPQPISSVTPAERKTFNDTRRIFSSRRSQSLSVDGRSCSHLCPISCRDDYAPECAVSGTGRRVFLNHCKLDYNSCLYGTVWQRRPLSECVGGKKADVQQNRGFIDWMQRVGIVDNKGRLVLSYYLF